MEDLLPELHSPVICGWAFYKGIWHTDCNSYLTTTIKGDLNYTFEEIPHDLICPNCKRRIEQTERQFGRKQKAQ